ncbi:MAG: GlyGly-CTERM sorting domain-containing protein [Woeseiaceae bacterium]|jgi:hypothetical protein|nr:GlyGly-CTERM sorting domain-containing protein [Woeseiaceae bacterium]
MEINELAALGYIVAVVLFSILSALMLSRWKDRPRAAFIALASAATAVWATVQAVRTITVQNPPPPPPPSPRSSGGGSFGVFGLLFLLGAVVRRRIFVR